MPRPLRPVLAVQFVGSAAGSTVFTFIGIWAIDELGASNAQLAFGFLFGAIAASISGFAGGHLSDQFGRRPVILVGWSLQAGFMLCFLAAAGAGGRLNQALLLGKGRHREAEAG